MNRLAAILVLVLCLFASAAAQPPKVHRVGFVSPAWAGPIDGNPSLRAFRDGMRELGYVEGRNFVLDARAGEGRPERIAQHFAELASQQVDVLLTGSVVGALAAKKSTTVIPIVFAGVLDPVGPGIVPSLARPGGNVTGTTFGAAGSQIAGKWLELLKEAVPRLSHVAVLANSADPQTALLLREIEAAARSLKVRIESFDVVAHGGSLDKTLAAVAASRGDGMIVANNILFTSNDLKLVQFANEKKLPAIYFFNQFTDKGGLMSYGGNLEDTFRRAAGFVDKILKGAKPGDLPVDQPTRFELVVNQKAAKALGVTLPQSLLIRADRIIQ